MKLWLNVAEGAEYAGVCRDLSLAMTERYSHLSLAAVDATIRLLESCTRPRADGDSLETPRG